MEPISTTLISQFVVAGAGMFIDSRNSGDRIQNAREHLLSGIREDLVNSVASAAALQQEWQTKGHVEEATLDKLKRCALTYQHNEELLGVLCKDKLVCEYTSGSGPFGYFRQIVEIAAAMTHSRECLHEIEHAFSEKIYRLRITNPAIRAEEAVDAVVSALEPEHRRYYNSLLQEMEMAMARLNALTATAGELERTLQ